MDSVLPGWYPDPAAPASGTLRWWNGEVWTTHLQAPPQPLPVVQAPAETAYVPFSASNSTPWAAETPVQKRTSPRFLVVAFALLIALGAGAILGVPAVFGPTGPLASQTGFIPTPAPTSTYIPVQADLPTTPTPAGFTNLALHRDPHSTAAVEYQLESKAVAGEKNSEANCDPLWYGTPLTSDDAASTDPVQILPIYVKQGMLITAVSRQFSSVDAASAEQTQILALAKQCDAGYTDKYGKVRMTSTPQAFAPASSVAWQSTITKSSGKTERFFWVEERVANRSVRVTCGEKSKGAAPTQCIDEMTNVAKILAASSAIPAK